MILDVFPKQSLGNHDVDSFLEVMEAFSKYPLLPLSFTYTALPPFKISKNASGDFLDQHVQGFESDLG